MQKDLLNCQSGLIRVLVFTIFTVFGKTMFSNEAKVKLEVMFFTHVVELTLEHVRNLAHHLVCQVMLLFLV